MRADDSARVLDRHLDEIADADLDIVAVVNPGCYRQLQQGVKRRGLRTRVVHLAELLAGEDGTLGTVVLHTGVGILADVGAGAAWWAV